jgi:hypothetical protein
MVAIDIIDLKAFLKKYFGLQYSDQPPNLIFLGTIKSRNHSPFRVCREGPRSVIIHCPKHLVY